MPSINSSTCFIQVKRLEEKCSTQMKRFARVPVTVLFDRRLSAAAKSAYAVMVAGVSAGGNSARIGMRLLGALVERRSAATASRWILELEQCGHIRRRKGRQGSRNTYEFTSPVFQAVFSTPVPEIKIEPPARQMCCGNCHRATKALGKAGLCRTCVSDAHRLHQWEAARVELGPGATEEQIVSHLNIRKLTAGWRKVMRRAKAA